MIWESSSIIYQFVPVISSFSLLKKPGTLVVLGKGMGERNAELTTHQLLPDLLSEMGCELDLSPLYHVCDIYKCGVGAGLRLNLTWGWLWTVSC